MTRTRWVLIGVVAALVGGAAALAAGGATGLLQLNFLASGTGAASRSALSKLRDFVSVMDFGATGDGSTDDTSAIQAAITAANGGEVVFPCGAYKTTAALTASTAGVKLQGHGFCSSLRIAHTSDAIQVSAALFRLEDLEVLVTSTSTRSGSSIIKAQGSQGYVGNVRFTGNGTSPDNGHILLLADGTADNWHLDHARVTGGVTWTDVIRATAASSANTLASTRVSNLNCVNPIFSVAAFDIDGAIDTFQVSNTDCPTFGGKAIYVHDAAGAGAGFPRWVHFVGTSVEGGNGGGAPAVAIDVAQVRDFSFTNGYVASATNALAIGASAETVRFSGNEVVAITQSAVTVASGATDLIIADNVFSDCGTQTDNTYDVIAVTATASNWSVDGNYFKSSQANKPKNCISITVGATDNYQIRGNRCQNTSTGKLSNSATGSNRNVWANLGVTNTIAGDSTTYNTTVQFNPGAFVDARGGVENAAGDLALTSSTGIATTQRLAPAGVLQASLGTPSNGQILYCSDCTIANPCAGGGTGAIAKRLNGVWVCN